MKKIALISLMITVVLLVSGVSRSQIVSGAPIFGMLNNDTPFIEYPLALRDGETVEIDMRSTSGDLDPLLYLVDENSVIVVENDDRSPNNSNAFIRFVGANSGSYTVVATRFGIERGETSGEFTLTVTRQTPTTQTVIYNESNVSDEALAEAGYPKLAIMPRAEWTILAYFGGDTNLESGVMNDFNEFELAGGSSESVRIIALLDRHPEFERGSGDWKTARLFEIEADISNDHLTITPPTLDSTMIADLGDVDTSDGKSLAQFLVWGIRHYPAERYAILLGSHGGAWQGIVTDDTQGESILSLPELQGAFAAASQEAQGKRFELLINDACLMSSLEYHSVIDAFFEVSVASPEIVVDPALNMTHFTQAIQANPQISPFSLGQLLTDEYIGTIEQRRNQLDRDYLSYSVTDLAVQTELRDRVEAFAKLINRDAIGNSTLLGQARANAYTYSSFLGANEQIDLGDFMNQILARTTNQEIRASAEAVLESLEKATAYANAPARIKDRLSFHNIYFPSSLSHFELRYLVDTPLKEWGRLLRNYFNATSPRLWRVDDSPTVFHPPIAPTVKVTRVYPYTASLISPPTINVEIVGRRIAEGAFTIDRQLEDGSVIRLAETSILTAIQDDNSVRFVNAWDWGIDRSVFQWMPFTLPVITDGTMRENEFLRQQGDLYALDGRYREPNSISWSDVTVLFDKTGALVNVVAGGQRGGIASIRIPVGSVFQSYRQLVTPNGNTKPQLGTLYTWNEAGLSWSSLATPSGNYQLGFIVYAFGGNVGFDSAKVRVNNDNMPENTRGTTNINVGVSFQTPDTWSPVVDYGNWLSTHSPEQDTAINIYYFDAPSNLYEIARDAETRYGLRRETELLSLRFQNTDGLYFDHSYSYEDGTAWRGRAVVFYRNTLGGGRGLVFSVDTRADNPTKPADIFRTTLDKLTFIGVEALLADDLSEWQYLFYRGLTPYPRLKAWDRYDEGTWVYQNPKAGYKGLTFSALGQFNARHPAEALGVLLQRYAPTAQHVLIRAYQSQRHFWHTASYTRVQRHRNELGRIVDAEVLGRIYTTKISDVVYAWRFETPLENASPTLRNIFEPMVDGFAPSVDFENGGAQTAFIKSATIAQSTFCPQMSWGTLCYGGGNGVTAQTDTQAYTIERVGERIALDRVSSITVGVSPQGEIDPRTVALLTLQTNLPDRNVAEYVRVFAFGGVTLTNETPILEADQLNRVQILNESTFRINLRATNADNAPIVGALAPQETAFAVAQSQDGQWVRVLVPRDEAKTGWIPTEFIRTTRPNETIGQLPIGKPELPYLTPYQALSVSYTENATNLLRGLVIQTSITQETLYMSLNGTLYELKGGLTLLWDSDTNTLTNINLASGSEVFTPENTNRVPETTLTESVQTSQPRIPLTATVTPNAP